MDKYKKEINDILKHVIVPDGKRDLVVLNLKILIATAEQNTIKEILEKQK
jgi:hypothetical protein